MHLKTWKRKLSAECPLMDRKACLPMAITRSNGEREAQNSEKQPMKVSCASTFQGNFPTLLTMVPLK